MALWHIGGKSNGPDFLTIQFFDADPHVLGEHEIEERLLLAVEVGADLDFRLRTARSSRSGSVGNA